MSSGSVRRKARRQALKEQGLTFSQRVQEAMRTHRKVQPVKFNEKGHIQVKP